MDDVTMERMDDFDCRPPRGTSIGTPDWLRAPKDEHAARARSGVAEGDVPESAGETEDAVAPGP